MSEEAPQSGLNETLAQAQQGGFFRWFHLSQVDESDHVDRIGYPMESTRCHRFRPSGPSFHHLVELELDVDGDSRIEVACLGIDRAFIEKVSIRPFARDIVKSFLTWILPPAAADILGPEIKRIGEFCDGESTVIVHASSVKPSWRPWWSKRSDDSAADAFMGISARAVRTIGKNRIVFENLTEPLPHGVALSRPEICCAVPNQADDAWLRIMITAM